MSWNRRGGGAAAAAAADSAPLGWQVPHPLDRGPCFAAAALPRGGDSPTPLDAPVTSALRPASMLLELPAKPAASRPVTEASCRAAKLAGGQQCPSGRSGGACGSLLSAQRTTASYNQTTMKKQLILIDVFNAPASTQPHQKGLWTGTGASMHLMLQQLNQANEQERLNGEAQPLLLGTVSRMGVGEG